jgi:1-deoxy-D-xylulose-5-phosphate reductoisomerase
VKRVAILGSTGSIGTQTIEIVKQHPDRLQVVGLAAGQNADALKKQAAEFPGAKLAIYEQTEGIPSGMSAIVDLATTPEADIVVVSVAGVIGLEPTVAAVKEGKHIALASKEVLVAAGELVMPLIGKHHVLITPIDSEHSAIYQCLQGYEHSQIRELLLTASGGPFRGKRAVDLKHVTREQALNHPTWNMGGKRSGCSKWASTT